MYSLSVVIVNYNAGSYLVRCINSLLRYKADFDIEIIIVDNASDDGSISLMEELDSSSNLLKVIENTANLGFAKAVNIGLTVAQKEFILILNPDCYIFNNTLNELFNAYTQSKDVGLIGAAIFNEDGSEQRGGRRREPTLIRSLITMANLEHRFEGVNMLHSPFPTSSIEVEAVSGAAMLLSRNVLQQIGGMDEHYFLHCEDLDLCHEIRKLRLKVIYASKAIIVHTQGVSGQAMNMQVETYKHQGMLYYYSKHYSKHALQQVLMRCLILGRLYFLRLFNKLRNNDKQIGELEDKPLQPLDSNKPKVIITGGRSDVGDSLQQLISNLDSRGVYDFIFISRRPLDQRQLGDFDKQSIRWLHVDLFAQLGHKDLTTVHAWINLAPVWTVKDFWPMIEKLQPRRIISLSSTSVITKKQSHHSSEQKLVSDLESGERMLLSITQNLPIFVLRPTMIYGGRRNKNINLIKKIAKYIKFFPIVGDGHALRQPVHADDVATACLRLLYVDFANGVYFYNLPGKTQLSYRKMVESIFRSCGVKPRIISVPLRFARLLLYLLGKFPGMKAITAQAANRMQQDMVFSYDKAKQDFDYQPDDFRP